MLNGLIRKIHIYAGLLTFAQLVIYGVAGLVATTEASPESSHRPTSVKLISFQTPASATDKEVAGEVYRQLNSPLIPKPSSWSTQRTPDNHLQFEIYTVNGIYRVTVLEEKNQLRTEHIRSNHWQFINGIHTATLADVGAPELVKAWAAWNELGMWSLVLFCLSGLWLWLTSRPRFV